MDPLSVIASVIAIVGATGGISKTVQKIASMRGAPDAISALNNEISDLRLVLQAIETHLLRGSALPSPFEISLCTSLDRAKAKILELETVIEYQIMTIIGVNNEPRVNRIAWARRRGQIQRIQDELRLARLTLTTVLGAATSSTSSRLELNLRQVQVMIEDMHEEHRINLVGGTQTGDQGHRRIQDDYHQIHPEGSLNHSTTSQIEQRNTTHQYGHSLNDPTYSLCPEMLDYMQNDKRSYTLKISNHYELTCPIYCRCVCHRQRHVRSPRLLERLFGSLFIGYVGLPVVSSSCDLKDCSLSSPTLWIDYYFPAWFFRQKLHCIIKYIRSLGPEQSLRVREIIPHATDIVISAVRGDVENMRLLLTSGSGSPFDAVGRYPILHCALLKGHSEICKTLIHAGADPYEENIMIRPAHDIAWDKIFSNHASSESLRVIFLDSDAVEKQHFSLLHKVVLGICPLKLSTILPNMSCAEINANDIDGRTALWWAASRGADDTVDLLLHYGADPNLVPWSQSDSTLQVATASGNLVSIKRLFEAGARMEHQPFDGVTPLHFTPLHFTPLHFTPLHFTPLHITPLHSVAFRHDSIEIAKLIHSHGADVNAQATFGETALMLALAMENTQVAAYLINQSADINIVTHQGANALFYAIQGNNLSGVRLLFRYNINHNIWSSVHGTILHFAARYASLEMLEVLYEAHLVWSNISDSHKGVMPLQIAQQRTHVPAEWFPTFMKLLNQAQESDAEYPPSYGKP